MTDAHDTSAPRGGHGHGHRHGHDHDHGAMGADMATRHKRDQAVFHELLRRHDAIRRSVTELANGIRAETWSDDPQLAGLIKGHAHEMHRRLGEGFGLRHWDPPFVEIFAQADRVKLVITETDNGVIVEETSDDPNVVKLIHAHGAVVTGFVESGGKVAAQPTPLPEDYEPRGR